MEKNFINSMGLRVFSDDLGKVEISRPNKLLLTISPNSYGLATKDAYFREALENTDYLTLDGVYFGLAAFFLHGELIKRNQGPDVFDYYIKKMDKVGGRVFFLGSTEETLRKIREQVARFYPNVHVGTYSPPFKAVFSESDNSKMLEEINNFKPDIVFVGMTAPKQEKWGYENKDKIDAKLTCCVGAVFDWFAGNEKKISQIWWKLRLAWLIRTLNRPEILKRYPSISVFFWHLLLVLLSLRQEESIGRPKDQQ